MTPKEAEEIAKLNYRIEELEHKLEEAKKIADLAQYDSEVARWALVGLARTRVHVTTTFNMDADNAVKAAEIIGRRAAVYLLSESKVAFNYHSTLYEMRSHINYLENHARNCGISFTPWLDSDETKLPNRFYYPKAFSSEPI